jgi:hypothetical protein
MPPEILKKLRSDGIEAVKPIKDNALGVNFLKLQSMAVLSLQSVKRSLETTMRANFPPEKLAVSKTDLDNSWETLQTSIIGKYETETSGLDPKCAPDGWQAELDTALAAQKTVLDAGYASFWEKFIQDASLKELDALRTALDDLVSQTAAGDTAAWEAAQLTATDAAKSSFKNTLSREYKGPDVTAVRKTLETDVDSVARMGQALWAKRDQDILEELGRRLKRQQNAYSTRLSDSLVPERQPPAFDEVVTSKTERVSQFEYCCPKAQTVQLTGI